MGLLTASGCSAPNDPAGTFRPTTAGVLTVATSLPAPGFWEASETGSLYGGFEYSIALDLADRFGLDLRIVNVPFDQIVEGDMGGADLALAQITFTRTRLANIELSTTYYPANMGVLAIKGESVADMAAARGLRWAVEDGTTQVSFLETVVVPMRRRSSARHGKRRCGSWKRVKPTPRYSTCPLHWRRRRRIRRSTLSRSL